MNFRFGVSRRSLILQEGMTLMEVLVAVALMGMVITVLLMAFNTGTEAVVMTDEMVTARNMAQSQMELIQSGTYMQESGTYSYSSAGVSGTPIYAQVGTPHAGWQIEVDVDVVSGSENFTNGTFLGVAPPSNMDSIQQVTVTVLRDDETEYVFRNFKVNR